MKARNLVVACIIFFSSVEAWGQEPGDTVILESSNVAGVPIHPADGDKTFVRWPNGSGAKVLELGIWIHVETLNGDEGWVTNKYVSVVLTATPEPDILAYVVGSWNLEHFRNGAKRGFPENTNGGPTYDPDERSLARIAEIIRDDIQAAVLVLNEINGLSGSDPPRSNEMKALVKELGAGWEYVLSSDGGAQRTAILYDTFKVERGDCLEFGNFAGPRDHLGCLFTFLAPDGSLMNDLVVIGVHLKSGQSFNIVHNAEMSDLEGGIAVAFDGDPFPDAERDVVIAGDFNANLYDSRQEDFWVGFAGQSFDINVLAPADADDYSPTRLASVPLRPKSIIDYVMASGVSNGVADDLVLSTAHVHDELLSSPFEEFRRVASDHMPVTVRIRVTDDDD